MGDDGRRNCKNELRPIGERRGARWSFRFFDGQRLSWEGERETPYSDLARVSLCRGYGIVEYPLSAELDDFGREISCYGIIEFENFIRLVII